MKEKVENIKSVNLPKTGFPMKADLPKNEPEIAEFWQKEEIYKKIAHNKNAPKGRFILHDGPPYANGNIHLGHALNKILKDIIVKFKALDGYCTPYTPGWDCHGLPIEHQLMKQLKTNKSGINRDDFRKKAEEFAMRYVEIQKQEFKRLGILSDWDNPYLTMKPNYEYGIVRTFNELLKKGYIYRSKKPVFWCISCETALADAEVEYENHVSPSIFVKFPLVKDKSTSILIWTTTPWTLPANVAVAVNPQKDYGRYKTDTGETYIAASDPLLEKEYPKLGIVSVDSKDVIKGSELLGLELVHPFRDIKSRVVGSKFVQMDTGAGTIHIAPGHGLEDYQVGIENNLSVVSPVNERGLFTSEVKEFEGQMIFRANEGIINKLKAEGLLLHEGVIEHSYPHCWRCKQPVIFRATEQWFLSMEHKDLRKNMLSEIKKVKWTPDYGENRITAMVESRPDWCLTRQRYWGTPFPVIFCAQCHSPVTDDDVLNRINEIFKEGGSEKYYNTDYKDIVGPDFVCGHCGSSQPSREDDILDVWFDSGVSHEAVLANPEFGLGWPADMYLEGSDQHRGWFQTSLIPAVALRNKAPYKVVLTHGFTVDGQGRKMSKSQGNVVAPQEIMKDYGADILRLWVAASDYREDVRVSADIIKGFADLYRKIRNTFRYLLGNTWDYDAGGHESYIKQNYDSLWEIDKFILHRLQKLVSTIKGNYENYEFHKVIFYFNQFCTVNLSAFYFDVLKDRLYTFGADSEPRRHAQAVLWELAGALARLISPILSFTAEETWGFMLKEHPQWTGFESVFLAGMPEPDSGYVSQKIEDDWNSLLKIREKVNTVLEDFRNRKIIGSSLEAKVTLYPCGESEKNLLKKYRDQLEMIFIVSKVEIGSIKNNGQLAAEAAKAGGEKCSRCWRYTDDASDCGGQLLCARCREIL